VCPSVADPVVLARAREQETAAAVHARPVRTGAPLRSIGPQARRIRPTSSVPVSPDLRRSLTDPLPPSTPETWAPADRSTHSFAASDIRRLAATGLSAVVPGLGQALNGRRRPALVLLIPTLVLAAVAVLIFATSTPIRLAATFVAPQMLDLLLTLSLVVLAWRLVAIGHAFFDRRYARMPGRAGIVGLAVILALVVLPHVAAAYYGGLARDAFGRFFVSASAADEPGDAGSVAATAALAPTDDERLNLLIVGIDKAKGRAATLTDAMMVASLDRTLGSVSLVSIPRDLVNVPLGDGRTFGPKLNSLFGYASRHRDQFPQGGMRALQDGVGALLGIRVHYYATLDFDGFADLIDAVGGVEVAVKKGFEDPAYDGIGLEGRGWSITAGRHLLDGPNALAYARSRKALGESDFTRQERQQQILVAFRNRIMSGGSLFFKLPALLDTFGSMVKTDLPPDRLPELAALADASGATDIVRVVVQRPLIKPATGRYGSVQIPDLAAIRAMTSIVLPPPGTPAERWSPKKASASSP
jgi:LCP family protein required for cell wall assembly